MRKFFIGLFQLLLLALDWFYLPLAAALVPCFLIRHYLFLLPYWVFYVSGAVSLLVNWLVYPFATGIMLLPVALIWDWLDSSEKVAEGKESPTTEKLP